MTEKIEKICRTCGKQIVNENYKYCSDECKPGQRAPLSDVFCLFCNGLVVRKGKYIKKYCSEKCKHAYLKEHGNHQAVTIICAKCGKESSICQSKFAYQGKKYCNNQCFRERHHRTTDGGQEEKRCTICKVWKPMTFECFGRMSAAKDGFLAHCKLCAYAKSKTAEAKAYRKANRALPDVAKKIKQYSKKRSESTEFKVKRNAREKALKLIDPSFALKNRVRVLMYHTIRRAKGGRKWQELVGYSIEDLRRHIEKQFTVGMTWALFMAGEIHIDHRIPVVAFNFTSPDDPDFKKCWALKNLRPMWALENISKGAKLDKPFQPSLQLRI
jgi:hypothetical protein